MILDLVRAFRPDEADASGRVRETVAWGPGPRAAQALDARSARPGFVARALAPSAEDVHGYGAPCAAHRMALNFAARARGDSLTDLIETPRIPDPEPRPPRDQSPHPSRTLPKRKRQFPAPLLARAEHLAGAVLLGRTRATARRDRR